MNVIFIAYFMVLCSLSNRTACSVWLLRLVCIITEDTREIC